MTLIIIIIIIIIIMKSELFRLKYFVSELVKWSLNSVFTTSHGNKFHYFTVYGIKELL